MMLECLYVIRRNPKHRPRRARPVQVRLLSDRSRRPVVYLRSVSTRPFAHRCQDSMVEMPDVTRAIAAATSIATSLDLPASDAIVLHNSNKLALRLTPCDVLARVAPARVAPEHGA